MPLFYVAHRLFAAHDRALGAYLASRLARTAGADSVFLPFCDTDEENLASDCKGRLLFELDCDRLRRSTGMIAVLHGPSLDDGVCMEIGFAAASGVPVVLVSTDFQEYAPRPGDPPLAFPDPLLEHLAASVIRAHRLGQPAGYTGTDRFRAFLGQNMAPVRTAAGQATAALLKAVAEQQAASDRGVPHSQDLVYLEPSPYLDDQAWAGLSDLLHARGWRIHIAERFKARADPNAAARADWAAARAATVAVIDVRGPETPPGAALITGACAAAGKPVLAACSGTWHTLADGREPNWRNLMIQYAVTGRFSGIREFASALEALPCRPT
jgi:nucleoside 2-deoxyribosyltransferase